MKKSAAVLLLVIMALSFLLYSYDSQVRKDKARFYAEVQMRKEVLESVGALASRLEALENNVAELKEITSDPDGISAQLKEEAERTIAEAERKIVSFKSQLRSYDQKKASYLKAISEYNDSPNPIIWKSKELPKSISPID